MDDNEVEPGSHLILYHNKDMDGFASAALVRHHLMVNKKVSKSKIFLAGFDYNGARFVESDRICVDNPELPAAPSMFQVKGRHVWMVDISILPEDMLKLHHQTVGNLSFNWYDHHINAIRDSEKYGYEKANGARLDGASACEIIGAHLLKLSPTTTPGRMIQLLGIYDTWRKTGQSWDEALKFQYGIRYVPEADPTHPQSPEFWNSLLTQKFSMKAYGVLMAQGSTVFTSFAVEYKFNLKRAFMIRWKGMDVLCLNHSAQSALFEHATQKFDAGMMFRMESNGLWRCSFYKRNPECDVDLSLIMTEIDPPRDGYKGGGGHRDAAGCLMNTGTLMEILNNHRYE